MKRFYLSLTFISITTLCMAQIGYSWWQFLPADFEENPYPRQTVMVQKISDDVIANTNSLEGLWGTIDAAFINPVDQVPDSEVMDYSTGEAVLTTLPAESPEDYTGSFSLLSDDLALYVLYKVIDDEVDVSQDFIELHFAPYGGKFDPGREIYADSSRGALAGHWWAPEHSHVWGWDTDTEMPSEGATIITGTDYVEMAKYGSWTEVGAYKVDLTLASAEEVFPPVLRYTLSGDDKQILGDVRTGSLPTAMQTLFEPTSDGYYFLAIIPWDVMPTGKLEDVGDQISIALKVNDYDSDNFKYTNNTGSEVTQTYNHWGGTDNNNAYWAIAFYGAIAELQLGPVGTFEPLTNNIEAYFANNQLIFKQTDDNLTVTIFDINGKHSGQFEGKHQINLAHLNAGYYVANIYDSNGNRSIVKFIKPTN